MFYKPPLKDRWQDGPSTRSQWRRFGKPSSDEQWYRNRFGTADVWGIGDGRRRTLVGEFP